MKHVEDDEHYLADFEDMQDKFEEIQKKYNNLIKFLAQFYPVMRKEPKEFLMEYEDAFCPVAERDENSAYKR